MSLVVFFTLFALTSTLQAANATYGNPEQMVLEAILADQGEAVRYSRPVTNASRPVWVSFGLVINRVLGFDEEKEILTVLGWNRMVWHDENIYWNVSTNGVTSIRLPPERIWTPDIHSYNGYEKILFTPNVVVSSEGLAMWVTQREHGVPCTRNPSHLEWTCRLRVSSATYEGSKLNLVSMWHSVDLSSYESHGHVTIIESTADRDDIQWPCCAQPYPSPSVRFIIVIRIQ